MTLATLFGIVSTIAFSVPIFIIIYFRLFINVSFFALMIYFFLGMSYNLMAEGVLHVSAGLKANLGVLNNYLDVPLMLTVMLMFCNSKPKKKTVLVCLILFVMYEIAIALKFQLQPRSVVYLMGPGIILIILYSLAFFKGSIRSTIVHNKGLGKTLMITSILFAYGCYILVYLFFYIQKTPNRSDVFVIYYIASIVFAILMSAGLISIHKKFKAINEVQTARRELALLLHN